MPKFTFPLSWDEDNKKMLHVNGKQTEYGVKRFDRGPRYSVLAPDERVFQRDKPEDWNNSLFHPEFIVSGSDWWPHARWSAINAYKMDHKE